MEILIKTTFLIILAFSLINFATSAFIYFSSRKPLYLKFSLFWAALIAHFFIQAAAQQSEAAIVLAFAFSIIPMNFLSESSMSMTEMGYPRLKFYSIGILGVAFSVVAIQMGAPFWVKALPVAVSAGIPMAFVAYLFLTDRPKNVTALMKIYAIVLLAVFAHNFNFAFFRMDPNAQLWGWPVAYAVYQILAALIPAMSLDFYHRKEQARLGSIIEQKTADLAATNVDLKEALEQRNYIFRTLVHDVSNPLMVISSICEFAEASQQIEMSKVSRMKEMSGRIEDLVQQVRDYEKVRAGEAQMKLEPLNLKAEFPGVISMFQDRIEKKKIRLTTNLDDFECIDVLTERRSCLNSIIPNILTNAIKFSPVGGELTVTCKVLDGGYEIAISDQGEGIPEEKIGKLFSFETNSSSKGTLGESGTGFGLPIVKMMQDLTGGRIYVVSNPAPGDSGTSVRLWFRGTVNREASQLEAPAA